MLAMQYSLGMFSLRWSSWMNKKAWDVHLCLDALREHHSSLSSWHQCSLPHILLSLAPNCFRDFCRCIGIIRSCLFLYSVPSLNSASSQASPTSHCWHHCESDPNYQDFPMSSQRRAATWAIWVFFHSLAALHFPWTVFQLWDRMMNRALLRECTGGKYPASDSLFHLSHGLSCNWLWPCTLTSLQSHWQTKAWCSPWHLEVRTCRQLLCLEQWQQSWCLTRPGGLLSDALTQSLLCQITSQESYLRVTWICLLLLHRVLAFGGRHHWKAVAEIQVPPNSLNISLDDGLGEHKA